MSEFGHSRPRVDGILWGPWGMFLCRQGAAPSESGIGPAGILTSEFAQTTRLCARDPFAPPDKRLTPQDDAIRSYGSCKH